ncbi:hypothetical protein [Aminobacter sp. HY435]|uniref:hypothetical protein n=1 Tax=Aminobacter sp. HY435 TaxID=2970917 RepID=UPI0022B994B6|nr:hypothetical protein [Aminobacter sp. HY435]
MKDKLGKPLKLGDRVAYATLSYKRAHLRFGIIVPHKVPELDKWGDLYIRVKGEDGSNGGLKQPESVLLVDPACTT